jgi:hypothetical protein
MRHIVIIVGVGILVLAIIDMLQLPLTIPTSCNTTNALIGAGVAGAAIAWPHLV